MKLFFSYLYFRIIYFMARTLQNLSYKLFNHLYKDYDQNDEMSIITFENPYRENNE